MIKAILFDADGVIISRDTYFAQKLAQEYNVDPEAIQEFFKNCWLDIVTGNADLKSQIVPYLDRWNWSGTVDELLEYWFRTEHHLDDRVLRAVHALRSHGIGCHLATNQDKYRLEYMKTQMNLIEYLDKFYCSCDLGVKKPQAEFYSYIIEDLQLQSDQLMFWDDTVSNVTAARSLGIHAFHYSDFPDFAKQIARQLHIDVSA